MQQGVSVLLHGGNFSCSAVMLTCHRGSRALVHVGVDFEKLFLYRRLLEYCLSLNATPSSSMYFRCLLEEIDL